MTDLERAADTSDPLEILDAIDRERGESFVGMIQANQVRRLRDEIVALRGYRVECERQFQAKVAEIGGLLDEIVALREMRKAVLSTNRAEALEEAARVCEKLEGMATPARAAAIRALKDKP